LIKLAKGAPICTWWW